MNKGLGWRRCAQVGRQLVLWDIHKDGFRCNLDAGECGGVGRANVSAAARLAPYVEIGAVGSGAVCAPAAFSASAVLEAEGERADVQGP